MISANRVLAVIGGLWCVSVIALAYPGFASFDTAYQWWMARSGEVSSLWPPTYIYLLKGLEFILPGHAPTLLFVLNVVVLALGAAILASQLHRSLGAFALIFLLCSPIVWVIAPQIWSDVVIGAVLLLAVSLLSVATNRDASRRKTLMMASFALISLSVGVRHNAIAAVLPLLWWWCALLVGRAIWSVRAVLLGTVVGVLLAGAVSLINDSLVRMRADTWAITAIWDLQAISVAQQKVLWPPEFSTVATVESMKATFDPTNAVATYALGNDLSVNSTLGLTETQRKVLLSAWLRAIVTYPGDYIAHRTRVLVAMLGDKSNPALGTSFEPVQTALKDNPPRHNGPLSLYWQKSANALQSRGFIHAGFWVCALGLLTLVGFARRPGEFSGESGSPRRGVALSIYASAALYLASLWVAAPTADLRYAFWPLLAAWAGTVSTWGWPSRTAD